MSGAGWRKGLCGRCGHEWFRLDGIRSLCARCEWPPTKPAPELAAPLRAKLLAWIDRESNIRTGEGSYVKGQRMMLRRFREELFK